MRFPGRPPSARVRRFAAFSLLAALLLAPTAALNAAPPLPTPAQVSLKGGHLLTGTVSKSVKIEGKPFSVIQTDFGEILAPQSEITGTVPAVEAGDTFLAAEVRIVRLAGTVERRSAGAQEWTKVGPLDPEFTGQPRPRILPGDTVRTGADGQLDVMLHRDAWVRLEADTEVEFSTAAAKGSLSLLRGATVQDVTGRPRGQTFRVTTPSTTLGVRGTRFGVFVDAEKQGVAVLRGVVRVGAATDVAEGQEGTWTDPATVTVSPLSEEQRRLLDVKVLRVPVDDMAFVPGGTYEVGATDRELIRRNRSDPRWALTMCPSPRRTIQSIFSRTGFVEVAPFLIDRREVAREEFDLLLAAESDAQPRTPIGKDRSREPTICRQTEAEAFAHWAGKALPTATQWHIAARGSDARTFPWGDGLRSEHCALVTGTWSSTHWTPPVALPPVDAPTVDISPFGLCAMVSSAPEWVRSKIDQEPIWPLLFENFRQEWTITWGRARAMAPPVLTCGDGGCLFTITLHPHSTNLGSGRAEVSNDKVGFRCVIELGGR